MQNFTPRARGFTLLELIIVIAILAVLSVAVILVINPAETLRRGRDSTRFSDMAAMKSAIGLYMAEVSTPILDGSSGSDLCATTIWIGTSTANITDAMSGIADGALQVERSSGAVDNTGWIPVNLGAITSGAPISNFPLDPSGTVPNLANVTTGETGATDAHIYTYRCDETNLTFEINGNLESNQYATGTGDKEGVDGGDQAELYEIGTDPSLNLIANWGV